MAARNIGIGINSENIDLNSYKMTHTVANEINHHNFDIKQDCNCTSDDANFTA